MKFSRYGSEVGYHSHFKTFKTFDAKTLSLVTDLVDLFFNETIHTLLKTHFHKRNDFLICQDGRHFFLNISSCFRNDKHLTSSIQN